MFGQNWVSYLADSFVSLHDVLHSLLSPSRLRMVLLFIPGLNFNYLARSCILVILALLQGLQDIHLELYVKGCPCVKAIERASHQAKGRGPNGPIFPTPIQSCCCPYHLGILKLKKEEDNSQIERRLIDTSRQLELENEKNIHFMRGAQRLKQERSVLKIPPVCIDAKRIESSKLFSFVRWHKVGMIIYLL